jgi:hypothetical protein
VARETDQTPTAASSAELTSIRDRLFELGEPFSPPPPPYRPLLAPAAAPE